MPRAAWMLGAIVALSSRAAGGASESGTAWADATASPAPTDDSSLDPLESAALARCGAGEQGLRETARGIVDRRLRGLAMPDPDALAFAQRAAGEPHPWARAWAASGRGLASSAMLRKLDEWLTEDREPRLRRCGVASGAAADGTRVLAVVAVEAFADLARMPTRARTGQWIQVEARLRVHGDGGVVIVLGPSGAPRRVPASFDGTTLRARFALDSPGEFALQVVADTPNGPRPVAEASVFADVDPPLHAPDGAAPGEDAAQGMSDDDDRLSRMLSAARASVGLAPLARDARLEAAARPHALRMAAAHWLAHDAGDGEPIERLRSAGIEPREAGENVAHAATVALAHRALWASPSHRANMLRREFDRVGVAVARDPRGEAWVVETFAGSGR